MQTSALDSYVKVDESARCCYSTMYLLLVS